MEPTKQDKIDTEMLAVFNHYLGMMTEENNLSPMQASESAFTGAVVIASRHPEFWKRCVGVFDRIQRDGSQGAHHNSEIWNNIDEAVSVAESEYPVL